MPNTLINTGYLWRRRVEVESTTRSAKERVAGFEGREGHRTPFASAVYKGFRLQSLGRVRKFEDGMIGLVASGLRKHQDQNATPSQGHLLPAFVIQGRPLSRLLLSSCCPDCIRSWLRRDLRFFLPGLSGRQLRAD